MTDCMSRPVVIRETDRSVSSGVNTVLYCVFFKIFILFFFTSQSKWHMNEPSLLFMLRKAFHAAVIRSWE